MRSNIESSAHPDSIEAGPALAGVKLGFRIRKFARETRKSRMVGRIARQCEKFLHGYYNQGFWDLEENGEARVIEIIARARADEPLFVIDVGANRGDWAKTVLARRPDAVIYCFEIVPAMVTVLRDALARHPTAHVCAHGLSSTAQDVEVFWNRASDHTSSIVPTHWDRSVLASDVAIVTGRVETGDEITKRLAIPRIDLLKIDVEGHEIEVLSGFATVLASAILQPKVIQFEYGVTWLPGRHNLLEAYGLLEPFGYAIGRLYPDGVDFKPYTFADDHFRMGNYIAVRAKTPLAEKLALFGG
jgi:FkbM family methyltransferase